MSSDVVPLIFGTHKTQKQAGGRYMCCYVDHLPTPESTLFGGTGKIWIRGWFINLGVLISSTNWHIVGCTIRQFRWAKRFQASTCRKRKGEGIRKQQHRVHPGLKEMETKKKLLDPPLQVSDSRFLCLIQLYEIFSIDSLQLQDFDGQFFDFIMTGKWSAFCINCTF